MLKHMPLPVLKAPERTPSGCLLDRRQGLLASNQEDGQRLPWGAVLKAGRAKGHPANWEVISRAGGDGAFGDCRQR